MKLMGFNFTKISAEKKSNDFKNVSASPQINISEVKEIKSNILKSKELILSVSFDYIIDYKPDYAKLEFKGNILLGLDSKKAKEILKQWKDKKLDEDFRFAIVNLIMKKSNIKAFQLEDEMNIPLHMPLPSIKKPNKN